MRKKNRGGVLRHPRGVGAWNDSDAQGVQSPTNTTDLDLGMALAQFPLDLRDTPARHVDQQENLSMAQGDTAVFNVGVGEMTGETVSDGDIGHRDQERTERPRPVGDPEGDSQQNTTRFMSQSQRSSRAPASLRWRTVASGNPSISTPGLAMVWMWWRLTWLPISSRTAASACGLVGTSR